jgi:para-aminobenzoate synthetase/4-amino-4-deoxychorismate lyase
MLPQVLLTHASGGLLAFDRPRSVVQAHCITDVLPALREVERRVEADGLFAAGMVSYEAAPAFDPAFVTHAPDAFPLLWFGLYEAPTVIAPSSLPHPMGAAPYIGRWQPSISPEAYRAGIASIKGQIARGNTYQVNYTFRLRADWYGEPWDLFTCLYRAQPTPFAAYFHLGRFALCSASPELFFRLSGETITCRPMKGTAARGRTLVEDDLRGQELLHSEKNRAENVMIVDMIRNDLGRIALPGSVHTPRLFTLERYPTVWQLTSTVVAQTRASLPDIFTALFPCASITGAPKVSTMRLIAALEESPRRIYTGGIGYFAPGRQVQWSVAIRTATIDCEGQTVEYGVGGGVVWDSTVAGEYEECLMKAKILTDQPPEFSLLESLLWTPEEGYFLLEGHLRRLTDSARYFVFPFDLEAARRKLSALALPAAPHKVRLLLHRDGGLDAQAAPLSDILRPDPARVRQSAQPVNSGDRFLYHKTTWRAVYEAALAACADCDDVLLWNERGELTEACTANLVLEIGGQRVTPPVSSGLLAGTFREWLLQRGEISERVLRVEDLGRCQAIYLINSVRKWRRALLV